MCMNEAHNKYMHARRPLKVVVEPVKSCRTCELTLPVSKFHRYASGHYREHCKTCWDMIGSAAKVANHRTKGRTKLGQLALPKTITSELRAAIREHYPTGGVNAVLAVFPDAKRSNISRAAQEMDVRYVRKIKVEEPALSDLETVAREAMTMKQFERLRVYYSHSGRFTTTPTGRLLCTIERNTKPLNIDCVRAQIVNAKTELLHPKRHQVEITGVAA